MRSFAAGHPRADRARSRSTASQEFFDILPFWPGRTAAGNGETMHLHCTDGDGEWLVRLAPDGVTVVNEHAKADVAAAGRACDLLLFL